ncbi:ectoine synthase [Lederbergia galactosidilytica]|uniref:L-ectoine synthase n=1 Tax=Lederbergia galactosidilytica TaxID=217031 RepID=A0A0Q9YCY3_9BACI|nr:ectoine synthase [Lederbergia galactosidilytica]KRG14051.1 L-ectoine synthase [Lederbergia galactosidilytica]KRG16502.1 L-ectoine synthase [Virgibacillus soli]MBP1914164.1 L-ectoine synthase [Lederbergia galactosidilytica]OAK67377.1 L-ectoine synthase [Lederbergia galactosidilytica]
MIVKSLESIKNTEDHIDDVNWESRRFLLKKDGMGFSLHDTIIRAGTESTFWYKYHQEAVYCIEGEGEIEDVTNGKTYQITAGTMYALDGHEKHNLRAKTDMRMVCVFNPPCSGRETHDEEGAYPQPEEINA